MARLKSCRYCGKVHANECEMKPKRMKKGTDADSFRSRNIWAKKRKEIRTRDKELCQVCIRDLHNTVSKYNFKELSVHHIIPLQDDFDKRLDNLNLLTVCEYHHTLAEKLVIPKRELLEIAAEQELKESSDKGCQLII